MKLFKVECGVGIFWVVAKHYTQAEEKTVKLLTDRDKGFKFQREVTSISVVGNVCEEGSSIYNISQNVIL